MWDAGHDSFFGTRSFSAWYTEGRSSPLILLGISVPYHLTALCGFSSLPALANSMVALDESLVSLRLLLFICWKRQQHFVLRHVPSPSQDGYLQSKLCLSTWYGRPSTLDLILPNLNTNIRDIDKAISHLQSTFSSLIGYDLTAFFHLRL